MNIDMYKHLALAKQKAKQERIEGKIELSPRKTKKFMITLPNDKVIHFGQKGYSDFLLHKDKDRQGRFHKRFKSNKGYDDKSSPLFYSRKILW